MNERIWPWRPIAILLGIAALMGATDASAQRTTPRAGNAVDRSRDSLPEIEERETGPAPRLELPTLGDLPERTPFESANGIRVRGFRILGSTRFTDEELAVIRAEHGKFAEPILERQRQAAEQRKKR